MKTQKFRVFRVAQKRGFTPQQVREFLRMVGAPPTLAEVPEVRESFERYSHFGGFVGIVPATRRKEGDERDITPTLAKQLVERLVMCPDIIKSVLSPE